ncbi:galactose-binding like protein [Epithele typhae]|uniref:galactose-binding like protein n=1 Tax=Epithele typhae TaxID=378194 RepID=UPI00200758E4|nr:galactose-binding like protein [Epithele typhae]KAH9932064.1 galactose-binding like protein [Epithele typhae]
MAAALHSLINSETKIKVSSTLDKSVGKKNLTDGSPETCWTSQQGTPQYIQLSFPAPIALRHAELTFQGGFVGTKCSVEALRAGEERKWEVLTRIYPEDVNRKQSFELLPLDASGEDWAVIGLKFVFEESSDFFGRVTMYDLQLMGIQEN